MTVQPSQISEPFLLGQGDFWGAKGWVWPQLGEKGGGRWRDMGAEGEVMAFGRFPRGWE